MPEGREICRVLGRVERNFVCPGVIDRIDRDILITGKALCHRRSEIGDNIDLAVFQGQYLTVGIGDRFENNPGYPGHVSIVVVVAFELYISRSGLYIYERPGSYKLRVLVVLWIGHIFPDVFWGDGKPRLARDLVKEERVRGL